MSEYKKEASLAVTIAVVGVLAMAAASVYMFPSSSGGGIPRAPNALAGTTTDPQSAPLATSTSITTTFFDWSSTSFMFTTSYQSTTFSLVTTTSAGWGPGQLINATLNSPEVQSYIKTAYSYEVFRESASTGDPDLVMVIINVTGSQRVTGNWTSGYTVSYTGIRTLNVTVRFTAPSAFSIAGVGVASFPDRNESIASYSPQQQQVIGVVLSNDTVRSDMTDYGLSPFYVENVTIFPIGNGTYGGDYFALVSQVNGPRFMGMWVNAGITSVVNSYEDSAIYQMCYYPGGCFTSPWNSTA
ncbi:MAG: hypothetical protein ABSB26_00070 [Nitrososphaerales archaeon]